MSGTNCRVTKCRVTKCRYPINIVHDLVELPNMGFKPSKHSQVTFSFHFCPEHRFLVFLIYFHIKITPKYTKIILSIIPILNICENVSSTYNKSFRDIQPPFSSGQIFLDTRYVVYHNFEL